MRKFLKKICVTSLTLGLLAASATPVFGEGSASSGEISISLEYEGSAIPYANVELFYVGPWDGKGGFEFSSEWSGCTVSLDEMDSNTAQALYIFTDSKGLSGDVVTTDSNGQAGFDGLDMGLYLISQDGWSTASSEYEEFTPFIVSLPFLVDGDYTYSVKAEPKTEKKSEESSEEESSSSESKPEESKPEESSPGETSPEESKPEESTPEESKPEESSSEEESTAPSETTVPDETSPTEPEGNVIITVIDEETGEPVPGVVIEITHPDGSKETFVTNKDGKVFGDFEEGEYKVTIVEVPDGYTVTTGKDFTITVPEDGTSEYVSKLTKPNGGQLGDDDSGHLPITGMVVWPITVFSILGLIFLVAGYADNRRREEKEEK